MDPYVTVTARYLTDGCTLVRVSISWTQLTICERFEWRRCLESVCFTVKKPQILMKFSFCSLKKATQYITMCYWHTRRPAVCTVTCADVHVVCVDVSLKLTRLMWIQTITVGQRKTVHVFICQRFHYLHLTAWSQQADHMKITCTFPHLYMQMRLWAISKYLTFSTDYSGPCYNIKHSRLFT